MSRIGKLPISLPAKVEVTVGTDNTVTVKGPKGTLSRKIDPDMKVSIEDGTLQVARPTEQKRHKAVHGLSRALINNMVVGVSEGYVREMQVVGVGFRVENQGNLVTFSIGYSHPVMFAVPSEISVTTGMEKGLPPFIRLEGIDKELIGQVCAKIRSFRKPEPYKGKGIRFKDEQIRRKAGKTAGGAK
ncbi:MAG: 50S ribosomal protein L6 [Lewinellaceae bacterium]|nr:50S ribosomal protein L6 [Saprospiraceae bacterium]MCB9314872.1 50S ribosomal protein L6 [Lewinellaceae bacterium]MCB9333035.1 50S ribosomal protein L6 [Lewinellaceae bacterium]